MTCHQPWLCSIIKTMPPLSQETKRTFSTEPKQCCCYRPELRIAWRAARLRRTHSEGRIGFRSSKSGAPRGIAGDCQFTSGETDMKRLGEHAIVIGASMSGLLAARALSDFYTAVTVLERDAFPGADTSRKGVPQGRHTHGLLARGSAVLEEFFPGYNNEVVTQSGGLLGDMANDVTWIGHNVTLASGKSDLIGLAASRPVLEGHLRRRLLALPNVRAIENCAVQGVASDAGRKSVTGVRARVDGKPEETVNADLVVDATGRGSSSAAWLEELGYQPPANEKVEIGIGYMTRKYRRQPTDLNGKLGIVVAGSAPNWRNGVILAQENDSWTVSAGGLSRRRRTRRRSRFSRVSGDAADHADSRRCRKSGATDRLQSLPLRLQSTPAVRKSRKLPGELPGFR